MATINHFFTTSSIPLILCRSSNASSMEKPKTSTLKLNPCQSQLVTKAPIASSPPKEQKLIGFEKVQQVQNIKDFDELLESSYNELVLVSFTPNHDYYTRKISHFMRELGETCNNNARLIYVVRDGSEKSKELCQRENFFNSKVPIFCFYKGMQKVHQVEGLKFDQLTCDASYYSENHAYIVQLYSKSDADKLISDGKSERKLIVINVGLKHCDPCARVYPTLLKLSQQMRPTVVFARMNGDENDSCKEFLRYMNVVEVPTFLFVRDGQICGRYVGSSRSNLIKEIVKYKGLELISI